jgi:DNA-binding response OmpR family regulator
MTRVLIIESDEGQRYLYQIALKFQKFEVLTANDAKEGLAMLKSEKPNLVLLDVMVPDLDQIGFLGELQKNTTPPLPLIILTDLRDGAAEKEAAIFGACEYLNKSEHSLGEIITSVRKAIDK